MKNIIFMTGVLEPLDYFSYKCAEAAKSLGADVLIVNPLDLSDNTLSNKLVEFASRPHTAVFLFNQFGLLLNDSDGKNYWVKYNIQVYDQMVDHLRNYSDALEHPLEILHVFALDRNHVNFIKRFYPEVKSVRFLPNGGAAEGESIEYDKRPISVIYCGSCQEEVNSFPVIPYLQDQGMEFYKNTIEIMLGNSSITTEDAIEYYFTSRSLDISDEQLLQINETSAIYIESYVRRYLTLDECKSNTTLNILC